MCISFGCEFDEIRVVIDVDDVLRTSEELYWQVRLLYYSVHPWICYPENCFVKTILEQFGQRI